MNEETIVAVYDSAAHADAAVRDLEALDLPAGAITRHSASSASGHAASDEPVREKGFWASLFGGDPGHDADVYDHSLASGSAVVAVKVSDQLVQRVTDVLERHNPVDVDERAAGYGTGMGGNATTTTTTATPASGALSYGAAATGTSATGVTASERANAAGMRGGEEVIALSEEQLTVGKRLVNRGTTRIRRFVVETPVEETVSLRSEHVSVERRPVTGEARVGDADFTERTIEVTETTEEPVVAKTAHVTEEVVISKEATERVETVRDNVRREDVEIIRDDAAGSARTEATTDTGVSATRSRT